MRESTTGALPRILSSYDVAEWLGRSPAWVRKHAETGEIPGFKVGKAWHFSEHTLARWAEELAG
jgi:hypothetical protein